MSTITIFSLFESIDCADNPDCGKEPKDNAKQAANDKYDGLHSLGVMQSIMNLKSTMEIKIQTMDAITSFIE
jgi:acyl carrier protein